MSFTCACGKSYKHASSLTKHGLGLGNSKGPCPVYMERKGKGEKLNVATTTNTINGNNNVIDNSVDNSTNINIQINAFGKEDLSMLTEEVLKRIASAPKSCLVNTYEKIVELEENRNVRNTDPSRPLLRVYDGEDWKRMDKKRIINQIIQRLQGILRDYVKDNMKIHRLKDDEFYNRVYKPMDKILLQLERSKINGVIVANT